jgi:hypothetical protein
VLHKPQQDGHKLLHQQREQGTIWVLSEGSPDGAQTHQLSLIVLGRELLLYGPYSLDEDPRIDEAIIQSLNQHTCGDPVLGVVRLLELDRVVAIENLVDGLSELIQHLAMEVLQDSIEDLEHYKNVPWV